METLTAEVEGLPEGAVGAPDPGLVALGGNEEEDRLSEPVTDASLDADPDDELALVGLVVGEVPLLGSALVTPLEGEVAPVDAAVLSLVSGTDSEAEDRPGLVGVTVTVVVVSVPSTDTVDEESSSADVLEVRIGLPDSDGLADTEPESTVDGPLVKDALLPSGVIVSKVGAEVEAGAELPLPGIVGEIAPEVEFEGRRGLFDELSDGLLDTSAVEAGRLLRKLLDPVSTMPVVIVEASVVVRSVI